MTSGQDIVLNRLRGWDATRLDVLQSPHGHDVDTQIDFHTPFPGDQPIRSGVGLRNGKVVEATIRYGVLIRSLYTEHPTNDTGTIMRLRSAVDVPSMPQGGVIFVNFGDTHRDPRPHLLYGWKPSGVSDNEVLAPGERHRPTDPGAFMDFVVAAGRAILTEFITEWDE